MSRDFADIVFRFLFSLIFIGLGGEHLVADDLIQKLMPAWLPEPRIVSIACGILLFSGGALIALGYKLRFAATMLAVFLVVVTAIVHLPGLHGAGPSPVADPRDSWIWDTLQRSNFVKNLCLLGVCIMLQFYTPGRWSLQSMLARKSPSRP